MAERPSVPKRLFEMARANLSSLFEGGDRKLADYSDEEIAAELQRREERRLREEEERRVREREELEARRRAAARRSAEAAERERTKTSAPRTAPRSGSATSSSSARSSTASSTAGRAGVGGARPGARSTSSSNSKREYTPPPKPGSGLDARRLREIYATLEVQQGATFEEIKSSYRRLMRKYHPDLHLDDPKKHKAATTLTMQLTEAYRQIEVHLKKK